MIIQVRAETGFGFNYFLVKESIPYGFVLEDDSIVDIKDVIQVFEVECFIRCTSDKSKTTGQPESYLTIGEIYPAFDSTDTVYCAEYSFIANGNIRRYMSFDADSPFIGEFVMVK
ncbi:hypothetical protein BI036_gp191 [Morganella phage vB_MmoM_MP1]|uniref:Uncharacterized protein n=1 Tax=Morganella phage vB_MmoM_MP1 TaxID=1852628 RepID=A0A192YCF0_9CAUD|nr:hypothetical protein BI036_gp191 [Morganella phage vB_MmoM_MP1]ANM46551.1 hypothetical protein MP1_gp0203 [Morganella phage vB_MmoM_MP1]